MNYEPIALIIVTQNRHEYLIQTLGSLLGLLDRLIPREKMTLFLINQDTEPAPELLEITLTCLKWSGLKIEQWSIDPSYSVAACRAQAIIEAHAKKCQLAVMFDGDALFVGNPILAALYAIRGQKNQGAVGWSHVEVDGRRQFPDFTHEAFPNPDSYLKKFKDQPFCTKHSPFHFYDVTQQIDNISTQGVWNIEALFARGDRSIVNTWLKWERGVRSYDTFGSQLLKMRGFEVEILGYRNGHTWNMYMKPDSVEGVWTSDAMDPGKIVGK